MKNIAKLFALMALLVIGANKSELQAAVLVDNIYYEIDSTGTSAYVRQSINTIETANILDVVNIDGKDYPVTSIGSGAFSLRKNLVSVNIGQNITTIGESAFLYCSLLPSVSLPAGLKSIGNSAFAYCTSLSSVSLPAGLKSVGNYAFAYCTSLSSVVIPDGVTSLGEHVFVNCSKLETVVLPSSLTSLGYSAFTNCSSLKSIDIPGSLATISAMAFEGCSSLASVTLNEGLQAIETGAFRNCVALESITFPESFASIGNEVFSGCTSLLSVTMKGSTPPVPPSEYWGTFSGETVKSGVLTVPAGSKEAYKASRVWGGFVNIIEEGVAVEIVDGLRFVKDAIYYEVVSAADKTVEVTFGGETPTEIMGEYTGNVVVPQTVNYENIDFKVIGVCDGAFYRCYSLVSVTLPEGMKYIGESAFGQCYELASVTLPEGLETIGYAAFSECSLTSVTLPASLTSLDAHAFSQCANVSSIKVKEGNTVYDSRNNCNAVIETKSNKLIWGCYNTVVPKGVTSIGDWAFRYCSNLTSITLPAGVTSIGREAFYYCKKMTSIVIPESVISLGNKAFMGCESLKSIVLPPNMSYMDTGTFYGCASLATVVLPSNLESIGYDAFRNCSSLASITIPASVQSIGSYAFYGCSGLTSITIPASVQSVDSYAFYNCLSLDSLFMERQTPPVAYDYTFNTFTNTVLTVPVGAKSAYKSANVWKNFVTILEEGENEIRDGDKFEKDGMFYTILSVEDKTVEVTFKGETYSEVNNEYSGEVIVPQTVNFEDIDFKVIGIGLSAFDQCSAVTSVVLPNSITYIGAGAFNGTSISSITLPASVTTVGGYAFFNCRSLASVILKGSTPPTVYDASFNTYETTVLIVPAGAKSAYQSANVWKKFATIREVGEGEIKDGDKFEKDGIFYTIISVEDKTVEVTFKGETYNEVSDEYSGEVVVPQTVNYENTDFKVVGIGDWTFAYCEGLKSVTIPNSITSIGEGAFCGCSGLTSVILGNSVTSIGDEAFVYCEGLTSVTIPNSVTSIGYRAFGDSGLTSVTIPNSVTSIGQDAFSFCYGLTSVTIPNSVTSIGESAFSSCSGLTSVTIPNSVTSIGEETFAYCNSLASIILEGSTPPTAYDSSFNTYETTVLIVPAGAKSAYQSANVWKKFATIREEGEGEGGIDFTNLIVNPNFENNIDGWSWDNSKSKPISGGLSSNLCVEMYNGSFDLYQDITDLPNGVYEVKVQAFYRTGGIRDAYNEYHSGSAAEILAYVYANDYSKKVPNIVSVSYTENLADNCIDVLYDGTTYVVNGMNSASEAFNRGDYECSVYCLVTDGKLRIGIRETEGTVSSRWTLWDNFRLVYHENNDELLDCLTKINEAKTLLEADAMNAEVRATLSKAFDNANDAAGSEAMSSAVSELNIAINKAKLSVAEYEKLGDALVTLAEAIEKYASVNTEETMAEAKKLYDALINVYENGTYTDDLIEAEIVKIKHTVGMLKEYVNKFEKDGIFYTIISVEDKTVEVTFKGETYDEVDNEYQGDVVIPQTVSYEDVDFTVVGVGEKALYGCDNIRRLSVPLTVSYFDKGTINSETLRELYWNSTMAFSKSVFVNPDAATNMILYITAETACDYDGNVVRDGVAEEILLTDALPLQITTGFKAKRISYNRHFDKVTVPRKPGGWESIVLPFDVQSFVSEEAGEIAPFNSGNAGAKPFMLAQMTGNGFAVATKMKANVPYILVMPNSEVYPEEDNIRGEVVFSAESASGVTVAPTVDAVKSVGKEFDLVPAYEGMERDLAVYALNEESIGDMLPGSAFVSGMREVKPFEAYASVESKPANAKTYFVIGGDDSATDIMRLYDDMFDGLNIDSRDGVLYIESPKAQNIGLYGSDGRLVKVLRLTEGTNTVTGLSKGVYVIGKKKVRV